MTKRLLVVPLLLLAFNASAELICPTQGDVWIADTDFTWHSGDTYTKKPENAPGTAVDSQGIFPPLVLRDERTRGTCGAAYNNKAMKEYATQLNRTTVQIVTAGAVKSIRATFYGSGTLDNTCTSTASSNYTVVYRINGHCGVPPAQPEKTECEEKRDDGSRRTRLLFVSPGQTGQMCDSNCMMNLGTISPDTGESTHFRINNAGGGANFTQSVYATYTGAPCSGTPQLADVEVEKEVMPGNKEGVCKGTDPKACIVPEKPNCGHVNGEYRCFTASNLTPENPCSQTASGAVFCRADAPAEAKPNNGTPGQPATPDVEFTLQKPGDTSGTVINYYKPSTVKGDSDDPGSDEDGDSVGNGNCGSTARPCKVEVVNGDEIGGGGDGEGEGEDGEGGMGGPGGDAKTFAASTGALWARVQGSDLVGSLGGLSGAASGGGECPQLSFQAFGKQISTEIHCQLAQNLSVLTYVFLAIYALGGIRIVMSA